MHILIIPSWYSTKGNPIRGSFFREQGLALKNAGHKVGFLVPPTKLRSRNGLLEVKSHWHGMSSNLTIEIDQGMIVYRISWWGWKGSINPWSRGQLVKGVFEEYSKQEGIPDILHGHSIIYGAYLAAYLGHRYNIPSFLTEHSTTFLNNQILPPQNWFVRYTLSHLSQPLAVSPKLAEALNRYGPSKPVETLPNLIDTDLFRPPDEEPVTQPFKFLAVGSLIKRKGHHVLLQAFASAFKGKRVLLQIVGEGPYRPTLEKLITRFDLSNQVQLLGYQPRLQVRDLMQQSHSLVSASFSENHPISMLEALACGKPIVASRSNGPEYFVNEKLGILVPKNDAEVLASAMRQMTTTYDTFDRNHIRRDCVKRFSEPAIVKRLEQYYDNVAT